MTRRIINQPVSPIFKIKAYIKKISVVLEKCKFPPPLQQVPTTNPLFILLTNPAWHASFDPPTSQNPLCRPLLALRHLPTPVTLNHRIHLPPLRRGTHLESGWDHLPSITTRGSLSTALWLLLMAFTLPSTTAGEYGGLR